MKKEKSAQIQDHLLKHPVFSNLNRYRDLSVTNFSSSANEYIFSQKILVLSTKLT